jgi:predicted thioesterase
MAAMNLYDPDEPIGVTRAAELLGMTRRNLQTKIQKGKVHARKIGEGRTSAYIIPRHEIDRILTERATAA